MSEKLQQKIFQQRNIEKIIENFRKNFYYYFHRKYPKSDIKNANMKSGSNPVSVNR